MTRFDAERGLLFVDETDDGRRLDRLLISRLKKPGDLVRRLIRRGNVRVNRKRAKPGTRVHAGDVVFVPVSLRRPDSPDQPPPPSLVAQASQWPVLFEDDTALALAKPAGIPVHAGSEHPWGVIELLRACREDPTLTLAHRLDRETSGVLLIAKGAKYARFFADAFAARETEKVYLAWVEGIPEVHEGVIFSHLRKGQGPQAKMRIAKLGKPARTRWRLVLPWPHSAPPVALLALFPESGRTHQLRVQLAEIGHPILGDRRYGSETAVALWRAHELPGIALHAWRLVIPHPKGGALQLAAPPPRAWRSLLGA